LVLGESFLNLSLSHPLPSFLFIYDHMINTRERNVTGTDNSNVTEHKEDKPGLQSEFQDSQGYTEKLCLEKPKKKKC
jgi:hypothetical protein